MYMSIKDLNVSQYNSKYLKYKNKYLTLKKMIGGGATLSALGLNKKEKLIITYIDYYGHELNIEMVRDHKIKMKTYLSNEFITRFINQYRHENVNHQLITVFQGDEELTDLSKALVESDDEFDVIRLTVYHNHSIELIKKLFNLNKNKKRIKTLIDDIPHLEWATTPRINEFHKWVVDNNLGDNSTQPPLQSIGNAGTSADSRKVILASRLWDKEDFSPPSNQNQWGPKEVFPIQESQRGAPAKSFNQRPSNSTQPPLSSFGNAGTSADSRKVILASRLWDKEDFSPPSNQNQWGPKEVFPIQESQRGAPAKSFNQRPSNSTQPPL